jgi:hypothetical protein
MTRVPVRFSATTLHHCTQAKPIYQQLMWSTVSLQLRLYGSYVLDLLSILNESFSDVSCLIQSAAIGMACAGELYFAASCTSHLLFGQLI